MGSYIWAAKGLSKGILGAVRRIILHRKHLNINSVSDWKRQTTSARQRRTSAAVWAACVAFLWVKAVKCCEILGLAGFIVLPTRRRTSVPRSARPREWMIAYL
jgi:hypothetical protein